MLTRNGTHAAVLLLCLMMVGCATSRSELKLESPVTSAAPAAASTGRTAVIRSVVDSRVFEQAPSDPSIPSLGFEGAEQATADTKARAIGRKRNTFGQALGDILLENGQTVVGVTTDNLVAALQQAGYEVRKEGEPEAGDLVIDVRINRFWAWFQPGFWAITLHTVIETDLTLSGATAPVTISVHAQESRQMATDSAWMAIVGKALGEYRAQVASKATAFP